MIPGSGRSPGEGKGSPLQCSAWRIPRTVQSTGSQRVRRDWAPFTSLRFLLTARALPLSTTAGRKASLGCSRSCRACLPGALFGAPPVLAFLRLAACPRSAGTRNKQVWWFPVVILAACTWASWGSLVVNAARDFLVLPTSYCLGFIFVLMRIGEIPKPDPAAASPATRTPLS